MEAVGINFGLENITVCKARGDDFIDDIQHAANPAYRDFFKHVLEQKVQDNLDSRPREDVPDTYQVPTSSQSDTVENLLRHELEAVIERLPETSKVVPAISVPYHWNETVRRAMFKAAEGAKIPLAGIHMLLKLPRALEWAYEIDSRTAEYNYFFIVVDYNSQYLHLFICETDKDGGYGIVEGQVQLPHLGANSASNERYSEQVLEAMKGFVSLTTVDGESYRDGRPPYNKIKAVILSGDASPEGMKSMKGLLKQVFQEDLLLLSHPPLYAGALGAARAAKQQAEDPKTTDDFVSVPRGEIPDEPKPS
ncbi:MAG: hypothetical protein L6R39_002649 [Caloplaca ligustica]|nr:MAG: hypothetical protein L6R39_002649 [Caloplaca ligustica]